MCRSHVPVRWFVLLASLAVLGSVTLATAQQPEPVGPPGLAAVEPGVPEVLATARDLGPAPRDERLSIAVSLPYARPEEMQAFVDAVSDPRSPAYRQFLTPEEVGERFGPPIEHVQAVAEYLRANGLEITLVSKNRLAVLANATVAQAEAAFHTTIHAFEATPRDAFEPARFVSFTSTLRMPAAIAATVIDVTGLETHTRPERRVSLLTPTLARGLYDSAPIFAAGMRGEGRTIGISNFDGFRSADWLHYVSTYALPTPVGGAGSNVSVVAVSGGGAGAGFASGEGDLDIQMALGIAPLASIRIYDSPASGNLIAVLTQEASDNQCDVISESYGWNITTSQENSAHNQHLSMSAQGISYFAASGDTGTTVDPYAYPNCDPEPLMVGGTTADVSSPSGTRVTEVGWSGSGGSWVTENVTYNVRPSWQTGTGVPAITTANNRRLFPDVAFHSDGVGSGGAYPFYNANVLVNSATGTSFAAPMFAGSIALAEQKMIALGGLTPNGAGKRRLGRMQDLVYQQNGRSDIWHDITSGSNGTLPGGGASSCHAGWDTVTGWGPLDVAVFADVVACLTGANCGGGSTGTPFCFGDGSGGPCSCVNYGTAGKGCANSVNTAGAELTASGTSSIGADSVVLSGAGMTNGSALYFQGTTQLASAFGDGVRCVGGSVMRLGIETNASGASQYPALVELPVSVKGACAAGDVRYYQIWYRDSDAAFCTASTFNLTNGYALTWAP